MKSALIWMAKYYRNPCPCTKCDEMFQPGTDHVYSCHCKGRGHVPMIVGTYHG